MIDSLFKFPEFRALVEDFDLCTLEHYELNRERYYWDDIESRGFVEDNPLVDCLAWVRHHPRLYSQLNRNKQVFVGELL